MLEMQEIFFEISMLVAAASILAWLATLSHQPIIIAYLACGVIAGPWGLRLIKHVELIDTVSEIGVTLLLFLAGMVLHPNRLVKLFKRAAFVTLTNCAISAMITYGIVLLFGYTRTDALYASLALMFSSTILVIKLLPTTTLHQKHMGSISIAILIAQDLIAVLVLIFIGSGGTGSLLDLALLLLLKGPVFTIAVLLTEQFVLRKMLRQSDRYHEVLFLLCLGWCLGLSTLAEHLGLSYEVGAFIAGVAIARNPISRFLTESLKPFRDFFLMFFFFTLGAKLDPSMAKVVWLPALIIAAIVLGTRPLILRWLFRATGEESQFSRAAGIRLGQASEFGLIIAIAASHANQISAKASQMTQLAIIFTMIVSSYIVVFTLPTPLGTKAKLKQD
jgi:glutathione-regulated potassium-efflux system ancillary protein KefC